MRFYPYAKWRGGGGSFSHAEGGGDTTSFGVVFVRYLEVLAILKGGRKKFPPLKRRGRGREKLYPVLRGGGVSDPRFSHFVAPPLPVINNQSLIKGTHQFQVFGQPLNRH